ncbi:hypothetical protein [Ralstonia pickettii]|uniref:hypothetical protein n=1 Tax=Ralstonia pickettii TaxID=329 RepID=UPI0011AF78DE|nr:hypothetical protein [Ralstonia pickettii]
MLAVLAWCGVRWAARRLDRQRFARKYIVAVAERESLIPRQVKRLWVFTLLAFLALQAAKNAWRLLPHIDFAGVSFVMHVCHAVSLAASLVMLAWIGWDVMSALLDERRLRERDGAGVLYGRDVLMAWVWFAMIVVSFHAVVDLHAAWLVSAVSRLASGVSRIDLGD